MRTLLYMNFHKRDKTRKIIKKDEFLFLSTCSVEKHQGLEGQLFMATLYSGKDLGVFPLQDKVDLYTVNTNS